jgi:hypothetical protein
MEENRAQIVQGADVGGILMQPLEELPAGDVVLEVKLVIEDLGEEGLVTRAVRRSPVASQATDCGKDQPGQEENHSSGACWPSHLTHPAQVVLPLPADFIPASGLTFNDALSRLWDVCCGAVLARVSANRFKAIMNLKSVGRNHFRILEASARC